MPLTDEQSQKMYDGWIRMDERMISVQNDVTKIKTDVEEIKIHGCEHGKLNTARLDRNNRRPALMGTAAGGVVGSIIVGVRELIQYLSGPSP